MTTDLRDFWHGFQSGVEVAVRGSHPETLLGVREGFLRFFHDSMDRPSPVAVVPQPADDPATGLPLSDEETIRRARTGALDLARDLKGHYHFYVASEVGLHALEIDGRERFFVRTWTVVVGALGESCGGSGSVELPQRLVAGLSGEQVSVAIPGTRRSGGMISSLTGGLETRRTAVGLGTLEALSSMFYGVLESRPIRRR